MIWPFGSILLFATLAAAASKAVLQSRTTPITDATWVLWKEYTPEFCWWETVELMRRLFLAGGVVMCIAEKYAIVRLLVALLVSIVYTSFLMQAKPYRRESGASRVMKLRTGLSTRAFLLTSLELDPPWSR
jgi:hypothetical protein